MTEAEYEERVEKGKARGWVYFIRAGSRGAIKVGWAKDPQRRLRTLQTAQPVELKLIGIIPGTVHLERDLHRRLAKFRISHAGEWFTPAAMKQVRAYIEAVGIPVRFRPVGVQLRRHYPKGEFVAVFSSEVPNYSRTTDDSSLEMAD